MAPVGRRGSGRAAVTAWVRGSRLGAGQNWHRGAAGAAGWFRVVQDNVKALTVREFCRRVRYTQVLEGGPGAEAAGLR